MFIPRVVVPSSRVIEYLCACAPRELVLIIHSDDVDGNGVLDENESRAMIKHLQACTYKHPAHFPP